MTTVTAPTRLHFGLLNLPREGHTHWPGIDGKPGLPIREFGGIGLSLAKPCVRVSVTPASEWSASGFHATRALNFGQKFVTTLPVTEPKPFQIEVHESPEEHIGLGVGTALGLAVARGISLETGHGKWSSVELAQRVGRGQRSAIGLYGFEHGGFILEAGKLPGETISPLLGAYSWPEEWQITLLTPSGCKHWHGNEELRAFDALRRSSEERTERLCRLLLIALLPALQSRDLETFSEAIFEYNYRVGEMFAPAQAGHYSSPEATGIIQKLREQGFAGVGQSSWGPTLFVLHRESEVRFDFLGDEVAVQKAVVSTDGALWHR
jgi:beta-RFAP synthase